MDLYQAQRAYESDQAFHAVVDTMTQWIISAHITPSEARAAAVLASIKAESVTLRPFYLRAGDELLRMEHPSYWGIEG